MAAAFQSAVGHRLGTHGSARELVRRLNVGTSGFLGRLRVRAVIRAAPGHPLLVDPRPQAALAFLYAALGAVYARAQQQVTYAVAAVADVAKRQHERQPTGRAV